MYFNDSHSNGMLDQTLTLAEVSHAVKAIKNNKSAELDGIVGELIKYGCKPMYEILLIVFNLVWNNEHIPNYWREGLTVSLYKEGDREDPSNYRGITLLNLAGKLYKHKMILNKNHASRVVEKSSETRGLTSNTPTYNTLHFYNPDSL